MSNHYSLSISGPDVLNRISDTLSAVPAYARDKFEIVAPGLIVSVSKPNRFELETIEEEFGFVPATSVVFQWYGVDDPVATRTHLIRGCNALLEGHSKDAVLLFNGEVIVLLRRSNRLVLNPIDGFWVEQVLREVSIPYEIESLESI